MEFKVCPDEVAAIVEAVDGRCCTRKPRNYATQFVGLEAYLAHRDKYRRPIALIIESPHVEEFRVSGLFDLLDGSPVHARPVNGVSGQNIRSHIGTLIGSKGLQLVDGHYPVIVMNAVQEQCSEGRDTLVSRTRNFLSLWTSRKAWLEERLRKIEPAIAINACTVGDFRMADGAAAYASGNRAQFKKNFQSLLVNEFGLAQVGHSGRFAFMGSLDLSGLVMNVIHAVYAASDTRVFKTAHPASWFRRAPVLRTYDTQMFYYD